MTNKQKTCGTCAYKSDGVNASTADYCYCYDKQVTRNAPACPEWRSSLRDEPVNLPEMRLVENVAIQDNQIDD